MVTETVSYIAVGIVLIVLGVLTWKKQTLSFLHSYHYKKVRQEDVPEYTREMGIGQIIVGIAFVLTALIGLAGKRPVSRVVLIAGLALGLGWIVRAQKRYGE